MSRNGIASLRQYAGHTQPVEPEPAAPLPSGNSQADRVTRRAAYRTSFRLCADALDYLARRDRAAGLSNQS